MAGVGTAGERPMLRARDDEALVLAFDDEVAFFDEERRADTTPYPCETAVRLDESESMPASL